MKQLIFDIDEQGDIDLLVRLARRLGFKTPKIIDDNDDERKKLLEAVTRNIDMSNYGDPVEWQRRVRKDRSLNPDK